MLIPFLHLFDKYYCNLDDLSHGICMRPIKSTILNHQDVTIDLCAMQLRTSKNKQFKPNTTTILISFNAHLKREREKKLNLPFERHKNNVENYEMVPHYNVYRPHTAIPVTLPTEY